MDKQMAFKMIMQGVRVYHESQPSRKYYRLEIAGMKQIITETKEDGPVLVQDWSSLPVKGWKYDITGEIRKLKSEQTKALS